MVAGRFMEWIDSNLWGIFAMPLGLLLCFGAPLVVWLLAELRGDEQPSDDEKKR
jgi:hypothetical protein